ncbi:hypothetical protein AK88_01260 [Plasmodium fragile]|uniref:Schizont-infected cell agglutination C-terminal domain-containing protein n=1 Tax=Plasmodium fragile TaxID=5857 RepID=A0A0D9QQ51_PLAFR|nr:uncharacterized protein AK88_01260 [Plasmodium fragile]KJP89174.1 hypothetical protein AK88_01260 [Plasmodium fragile]
MDNQAGYMEALGSNCNNAGWEDFKQGEYHTGQTVADMMRCRLMSTALWFANESTHTAPKDIEDERMRCEVVNTFGYILKHLYCKPHPGWKRGVEYAWKTFQNMGDEKLGTGLPPGPVTDKRCTQCGYEGSWRPPGIINGEMATWLLLQWRVMEKITHMERTMDCTKDWKTYQLQLRQDGTITANDEEGKTKLEAVKEEVKKTAQQIVNHMQEEVTDVLVTVSRCSNGQEACGTELLKTIKVLEETIREREEAGTNAEDSVGTPPGSTTSARGSQPQAPASPEQAPAPLPASEGTGSQGETVATGVSGPTGTQGDPASGAAAGPAPDSKEPRQPGSSAVDDYKSTCENTDSGPQSTTVISSGAASVSITPVTYNYGAAAPCKFLKELAEQAERAKSTPKTVENTKNDKRERAPSGETNVQGTGTTQITTGNGQEDSPPAPAPAPAPAPPANPAAPAAAAPKAEAEPAPTTTTTSSSGPAAVSPGPIGQPGAAGENGATGAAGSSGKDDVIDGGNDDPPPLNPPKPKPNPNPNQTGSSPSGTGGASLADGTEHGGGRGQGGPGGGGGGSGSSSSSASDPSTPGSTGHQPPGSSRPGSDPSTQPNNAQGTGSQPTDSDGGFGLSLDRAPAVGSIGEGYAPATPTEKTSGTGGMNSRGGPDAPDLTGAVLTATTPIMLFLSAVTVALLGYSLWKYLAYLANRQRKFRTVRDVPSLPLDEEILQHLQRGELPPPDYGYTMVRDRQPGRLPAARRRRPPRVHKRTIIELHLEVLNECEATECESVKDDYLQIVVDAFMRGNNTCTSSSNVCTPDDGLATQDSTTNADSPTRDTPTDIDGPGPWSPNEDDPDPWSCMENIQLATAPCPPHEDDPWSCMETIPLATDRCPPNADDPHPRSCVLHIQFETDPCAPHAHDPDPWKCMEPIELATHTSPPHEDNHDPWSCMATIQLATDPCTPNEDDPDPWNCMETIQLEQEQARPPTGPGDANPDCRHWINWIDRNKYMLRECTTQPWFLHLKADWKQYLREHMAADEDHGQRAFGEAATSPMKKLRLWKQWVEQQHRQMSMYKAEWFQHLLENIEEETVPDKGDVPGLAKDLDVEKAPAAEDMLRVRALPCTQLHPQPYMKTPLTANICIPILALVIEQCAVERRLQETELYVDALLQQC